MYNISTKDGRLMLGQTVNTRESAEEWLSYYTSNYPEGRPYPNGKGFYPDFGFHIVEIAGPYCDLETGWVVS